VIYFDTKQLSFGQSSQNIKALNVQSGWMLACRI